MSTDNAASCLLDIVVLAGGESQDLMPLSAVEPKTMLRVCNRPLIWYCIMPWIKAGFRTFFLCVDKDYAALFAYLSRTFEGIEFHYVLVPSKADDPSTSCDAVKAYLKYKQALRMGEETPMMDATGAVPAEADSSLQMESSGSRSPLGPMRNDDPSHLCERGSRRPAGGLQGNGHASEPLKLERMSSAGLPRDALLLSCDTILVDVDVTTFVERHYASLASVTALLYRPLPKERTEGREDKKAGGHKESNAAWTSFTHALSCVAYEEDDELLSMVLGSTASVPASVSTPLPPTRLSSPSMHAPFSPSSRALSEARSMATAHATQTSFHHHRMHFIAPLDLNPMLCITTAFAARRPQLTFVADLVDAHAYVMSRWVLEFIAGFGGIADTTVQDEIIPLLAKSQHTTVNAAHEKFVTPAEKLGTNIPAHWIGEGSDISVQSLNAAPGPLLPEITDSLRVFCSIYEETPDSACRVYRMNTLDNYRALNHEIVAAKCFQLDLEEVPPNTGGRDAGGNGKSRSAQSRPPPVTAPYSNDQDHAKGPSGAARGSSNSRSVPSAGALALANLLPDNPITVREKIGDQQVRIVGSFMDSVPPPNVFVTRSVIGAHVTLEPGARITDSVLMGNVEVGAKSVISHCIIGMGAIVNAGCRVTNTIVGPRCLVEVDADNTIIK